MAKSASDPQAKRKELLDGVANLGFDVPDDVWAQIEDRVGRSLEEPIDVGTFTKEFFAYSGAAWSRMGVSIALSVVGYALSLASAVYAAYVLSWIWQAAQGGAPRYEDLFLATAVTLLALVLHLALTAASSLMSHKISFAAISNLRRVLFERLGRVPQGYLIEHPMGYVRSLVLDRVGSLEDWVAHVMPEFPGRMTVPLAALIALFIIDWRVGLATLAPVPLAVIGMGISMGNYQPRMFLWMSSKAALASRAAEYIRGIPVIKAFLQADASFSRFAESARFYQDSTMAWWRRSWVGNAVLFAAMASPFLAVVPVAFVLFSAGALSAFELGLCLTLPLGILQHCYLLMSCFELFQMTAPSWAEIRTLLDYPELERPDAHQRAELDPARGVEFSDVRFSYSEGTEVLHGVSLTAQRGEVTALVGPSGSGKSTIARLVASFWDPDAGSVSLGGCDLRQMPLDQLMEEISYVAQDTYLFEGTIRDNIRLGLPDATDEQIRRAAVAARCDEFISRLPQGYDTDAGEAGDLLSGGERQRIALARAILKPSSFVILDEATAYTDPENEAQIQEAIGEVVRGRSLIVVAHRLNTIKGAHKIVVIEDGRVAAQGTHDELVASSSLYKNMWKRFNGEEL